MRILHFTMTVFCFLCLIIAPSVRAQDTETTDEADSDWSDAEGIDIFDEAIGEFLDLDLDEVERMAYEAYQSGDYELAARYYLAYLRYDITDGGNIYNLACCYGLLGEAELAAAYLKRAVNAGFDNIDHIMRDPDFDDVRGTDVFDATVEGIAAMIEESRAELGETIYALAPAFIECRVQVPEDYDPERSYTLLLGLHGFGSNPDRFITLWERFDNPDFIYASPRAPYPFSVGNAVGYSWDRSDPVKEELWARSTEMSESYVAGLVSGLGQRFNFDEVYLLGFSQGCAMTYMAGIHNHEVFDGLICFGGWLNTDWLSEEAIEAASDLRVFIAHGTEDRMVEIESGIEARDLLLEYGYDVTFCEFDGGHRVPEEPLQQAQEWMKR